MAIKINLDGILQITHPENSKKYTNEELIKVLGADSIDDLEFYDIGFFIALNNKESDEINVVASMFLRIRCTGNVILISGKELKNKIVNENNSKFSVSKTDDTLLNMLREMIDIYKIVIDIKDENINNKKINKIKATEPIYYYDPDNDGHISEEESEFRIKFFDAVIDKIKNNKNNKNNKNKVNLKNISRYIIIKDELGVVKLHPDKEKIKKTFQDMMDHFLSNEEYEKCEIIKEFIR